MTALAAFQLYRGVNKFNNTLKTPTRSLEIEHLSIKQMGYTFICIFCQYSNEV
jgi:hypothetical protein